MVRIQLIDFKNSIPSTVVSNDDGSYTIFLNSRLDFFTLQKAYLHELMHICKDDFQKYEVDKIEAYTHDFD